MKRNLFILAFLLYVTGCGYAAEGALMQANHAFAEGDYDDAILKSKYVRAYSKSNPGLVTQSLVIQAKAYEAKGDMVGAREVYKHLLDNYPNSHEAIIACTKLGSCPPNR